VAKRDDDDNKEIHRVLNPKIRSLVSRLFHSTTGTFIVEHFVLY
jgi:hypothetical protein